MTSPLSSIPMFGLQFNAPKVKPVCTRIPGIRYTFSFCVAVDLGDACILAFRELSCRRRFCQADAPSQATQARHPGAGQRRRLPRRERTMQRDSLFGSLVQRAQFIPIAAQKRRKMAERSSLVGSTFLCATTLARPPTLTRSSSSPPKARTRTWKASSHAMFP
jgi:hypothetical protein